MKALTVWQPWASLIILGVKPFEFRHWDYRQRLPRLVGQHIAIHAAARPIHPADILDILQRIDAGGSALKPEAMPLLRRLEAAPRATLNSILPLSAVLGTAVLGKPRKPAEIFTGPTTPGLDPGAGVRIDHSVWAWPLTDIVKYDVPVEHRGAQGFWDFNEALADA